MNPIVFFISLLIVAALIVLGIIFSKEDIKICYECKNKHKCMKQAFLCKCEKCDWFEKESK